MTTSRERITAAAENFGFELRTSTLRSGYMTITFNSSRALKVAFDRAGRIRGAQMVTDDVPRAIRPATVDIILDELRAAYTAAKPAPVETAKTYSDFVTLSAHTPSTEGGQPITIACPSAERLAEWVADDFAHMPHPDGEYSATFLPHRHDVCKGARATEHAAAKAKLAAELAAIPPCEIDHSDMVESVEPIESKPVRRGPSPEAVQRAMRQLQAEMTHPAFVAAVGAILDEPLPGESKPAPAELPCTCPREDPWQRDCPRHGVLPNVPAGDTVFDELDRQHTAVDGFGTDALPSRMPARTIPAESKDRRDELTVDHTHAPGDFYPYAGRMRRSLTGADSPAESKDQRDELTARVEHYADPAGRVPILSADGLRLFGRITASEPGTRGQRVDRLTSLLLGMFRTPAERDRMLKFAHSRGHMVAGSTSTTAARFLAAEALIAAEKQIAAEKSTETETRAHFRIEPDGETRVLGNFESRTVGPIRVRTGPHDSVVVSRWSTTASGFEPAVTFSREEADALHTALGHELYG